MPTTAAACWRCETRSRSGVDARVLFRPGVGSVVVVVRRPNGFTSMPLIEGVSASMEYGLSMRCCRVVWLDGITRKETC